MLVDRRSLVPSPRGMEAVDNRRNKPVPHEKLLMNPAFRCGARTRSGRLCQSPPVRGKRRCRMHGGGTGSGAPIGNRNAFRHGRYTAEAIARRRQLSELIRATRTTLAKIEEQR